ncbi:MAG: arginase family protein [Bacteroidales bacterium]
MSGNHGQYRRFRAFAERYGNLSILQLDAHSDLRQEYGQYNHACLSLAKHI